MDALQAASYAGLTLSCWEILLTFQDEVEHLWPQPGRITIIKVLYFIARYFPLALQIINTVISKTITSQYPVPDRICKFWLLYQAAATFLLLAVVDAILMVRVYAFYNRKRWISSVMVALVIFRVGLSVISVSLSLPEQKFHDMCLTDTVPSLVIISFLVGELVLQSIILGLTFAKQFLAIREGWGRTPLVTLLCRDGAATFTVITGTLIGTMIYAKFGNVHSSAHFVFPALISIMSTVGCRMTIGMQKFVITVHRGDSDFMTTQPQELTTIIESLWTQTPPSSLSHRMRSNIANE